MSSDAIQVGRKSGRTAGGITLVVPTYNRSDLIGETLASALEQTLAFEQIIVVDNGSTDDTGNVVRRFGSNAIRLVEVENIGVQAARNLGVDLAQTALVALCDSDDLLEPGYALAVCEAMARRPGVDFMYSNFYNFDEERTWPDKFSLGPAGWFDGGHLADDGVWTAVPDLYLRMLRFQPLFPSGLVFRREAYRQLGGFDPRFRGVGAEDWEFTLRAATTGRLALHSAGMVRIRRHLGNDSRSAAHMASGEAYILRHALQEHPVPPSWLPAIAKEGQRRWEIAFHAAFEAGDLMQAADHARHFKRPPAELKALLKLVLTAIPRRWHRSAWHVFQRHAHVQADIPSRVTVLGPSLPADTDVVVESQLLRQVIRAWGQAKVTYLDMTGHGQAVRASLPAAEQGKVQWLQWQPGADLKRAWRDLPPTVTRGADLVVLRPGHEVLSGWLRRRRVPTRTAGISATSEVDPLAPPTLPERRLT